MSWKDSSVVMVHTFNPSTLRQAFNPRPLLSSRPAWSSDQVPGQPELVSKSRPPPKARGRWRQCFVESVSLCSAGWPELMTPLPQPPSAGIISPLYLAHITWRGWFLKRYYYCTYGCVSVHTMTCMEVREQLLQIGSLLSTLHWFQEFCKAFACYSSYQLPPRSSSPPTPPNRVSLTSLGSPWT